MPRTLVIDTATAACSVALFDADLLLAEVHEEVGRGHAERLMPMIASLPDGGRADRLLVDCGPGSFTGVRVGLAAARALALGWDVPVHGYSSMAVIASTGVSIAQELAIAIIGGHGELFVQAFACDPLRPTSELASLAPEEAARAMAADHVFGSASERLVELRGHGTAHPRLPRAADAMRLAGLATLPPSPIYGRGADAKPAAV
ncbi:tRNA (adenosine(37)-N6)-threonylcarbamoyltransferase complex dimerization subunit type 1 TsaB [Rhizorhabdus phycosphaerae]|uniref:tRNA (adenosine(37)-N6)-threonylcarbamoyltransferase complex dimerization subunit type 1 TsaB n=1 Tax=Rhizorhabdus phycosphaerae TaxID=2711156 RepID=UPI0013ECFCFF|nr:tRNA (adenosine(37)-N6)-threonylcarbamoyltransferase complex dimerization subunit type 1 TsaB [Rhizorhabdus phycosphaerae]